jgi:hypothetical protein
MDILSKPLLLPAPVEKEEDLPPMPTLIEWSYTPGINRIIAREVRDHPRLGSFRARPGEEIITSEVDWLNRSINMAQTKNRLYRLEKEVV